MFRRLKRSRQAVLDDYTVEPMEPRVLLSADALGVDAGVLDPDAAGQADWDLRDADDWSRSLASHDVADAAPLDPPGGDADDRVEIVFLDTGVEDGQQLLADLLSQNGSTITQVHLIDSNSDGVDQIAQVLGGQQGIDAIHIISHGAAGQIQLGSGTLSTGSLDGYAGQLNDWGSTLADSGDILIYGCDLAADTQGRALVNAIGILTGADVAASVDQTGHAAEGGDWDLEYRAGSVEAGLDIAPQAQWQQVLALHAYEGFDYATGSLDATGDGGTGWDLASDWTIISGNSTEVIAAGLVDPSGSLPVAGGAAEMNAGGPNFYQSRDMGVTLGTAGTTAWASFLLKADVAGGQGISLSFGDNTHDTMSFGTVGNDFLIAMNGSTAGAAWIYDVVNDGETYLMVAEIAFTAGADTVSLYINPTPGLAGPDVAAGADLLITANLELETFKEIGMIGGGLGNTSTIDEIRVGDTFADVAPAIDTGSLWFTTSGDVSSHTGQLGSVASWQDEDAVQLSGPGFALEPGTTAGTFTVPFDPGSFSGAIAIDALHHVTTTSIVVGAGTTITLNAGDVLFSTDDDGVTFTSSNVLSGVNKEDVIFFRPDTPGDYSAGTFTMLLQNPTGEDIEAIALVERNTIIGDHTVTAGSFLYADATGTGTGANDVKVYIPGSVGAGSTGGATIQTLIDGDEQNGAFDRIIQDDITGIELVETNSMLGGAALAQGDLLLAMERNGQTLGDNSQVVDNEDIARLQVSKTTLVNGTTQSTGSLLLEGNDIGLGGGSGEFVGVTIASSVPLGGNDPLFQAAGPYSVNENAAATTVVGDVDANDGEGGAADVGINYGIIGNLDPDGDGRKAFTIDPFSGVITVNDADDLNYEDNPSLDITVEADDGSESAATTVTINLNNVNEAPSLSVPGSVFINEVHYDNMGVDTGEFIEIAGVASNNLNGWSLVLYNGVGGAVYDTVNLSGTIPNQADNFGTLAFSFPVDGIQNATGNPDGIALVDPTGTVVQFLSYEGAFWATAGPANGMLSTDIGVSEDNGTTAVGKSLQLTGAGAAFTWSSSPEDESFGTINSGQDFAAMAAATRQTINEGSSLVFSSGNGNAIVVGDVDAALSAAPDPVEITLSVSNGTLTLGSTTGLGAVAGDGSGSVVFNGTIAELNAALEGLTYQPNTDYSGSETLTVLVDDQGNDGLGGAQTTTGTMHITVDPINDAPTASGTYTLASTNEDTTSVAVQVAAILGDASITAGDVDGDTLGIAVFAKSGNGTWEYSTNGVSGWTGFGGVTPNAAVLLSETTWMRYVPDGANGETADFDFRAWDQSADAASVNGTPAFGDTTPGGGTTPYSSGGGAQVSLTVTAVNEDPVADSESFTVIEGGTATEADLDAGISLLDGDTDVDLPGDTLTVNTTPVVDVSHGTLTLNANGTFSYVHDGNENFSDSFTYEVSDGAGGTDTATVNITITQVNDAPLINAFGGYGVNEDDGYRGLTGVSITDVDAGVADIRVTLDVANGLLRIGATGGLSTISGNDSVSVVLEGPIAAMNSALASLAYKPDSNFAGSDDLSITVDDLGGSGAGGSQVDSRIIPLTVTAINDDPVADDESFTVIEGGTATEADLDAGISLLDGDTDVDLPGDTLTVNTTPVVDVSHGTLTLNANGTFSYVHDGTENFSDSFTYEVSDGAGGTDTATVTITITPANDNTPTLVNPIPDQSATEDVAFSFQFASATFNDIDAGDSLGYTAQQVGGTPLPGWLSFNGVNRTFSGMPLNADVGALNIEVTATDSAGATVTDTFDLTISNVNDPPVLGNNQMTLYSGDTVVITTAMLSATDVDHAPAGLQFTVSGVSGGQFELVSASGVGILSFSQAQVAAGDVVFVDDGDNVAPAYSVTVGDTVDSVGPRAATIVFNPPTVVTTVTPAPAPVPVIDPAPVPAPDPKPIVPDPPKPDPDPDPEPEPEPEPDPDEEPGDEPVVGGGDDDPSTAAAEAGGSVGPAAIVDFDSGSEGGSIEGLLKNLFVRPATLTAMALQNSLPGSFEIDALAREVRDVLASTEFNSSLDRMRDGVSDATIFHQSVVGSSVAVTTGLSVGYVAWLVRGGVLLSTALSSLPAWQFIDPLPVLARTRDGEDGDDDSLQSIIKEQSERAAQQEKAQAEADANSGGGS